MYPFSPKYPLPPRLPHNNEQSSMCYTVGPCWLSIINIAVCTCPSLTKQNKKKTKQNCQMSCKALFPIWWVKKLEGNSSVNIRTVTLARKDAAFRLWIPEHASSSCHAKLLHACLTLFDLLDCSLPGSSVHGILQARILAWVAISSSSASSSREDNSNLWMWLCDIPCIILLVIETAGDWY